MKKVLLGLLALSATLMAAPSTGEAGSAGENQIDITTKAFIVDSGLIITESVDGTSAIKSIELDHGTIMKTNTAASSVNRDIYIRKNGNNKIFPTGSILEISLTGNSNLANENSKIPHTLTAKIDSNNATNAGNTTDITDTLTLSGSEDNSTSQTNQFKTLEGSSAIKVSLKSDIAANVISNATNLAEGAYSNTSTLSVKFSKIPTVPGTSAGTLR